MTFTRFFILFFAEIGKNKTNGRENFHEEG
jgi:hypothetical protein